jgi:hypothetical protein
VPEVGENIPSKIGNQNKFTHTTAAVGCLLERQTKKHQHYSGIANQTKVNFVLLVPAILRQ